MTRLLQSKLLAGFEKWRETAQALSSEVLFPLFPLADWPSGQHRADRVIMRAVWQALLLRKMVRRMVEHRLLGAWLQWRDAAAASQHEKRVMAGALTGIHRLASAVRQRSSILSCVAGALNRILNAKLSAAFETWQALAARCDILPPCAAPAPGPYCEGEA